MMKKVNYHTHTERCHHAYGSDEELVLAAIKGGFEVLGFSDHSCWKYDTNFVSHIRMRLSEFEGYHESVLALKEKYKDKIKIFAGLECEYFPRYMGWLESFVQEQKLDYIILGNHYDTTDETGVYYGRACGRDETLKKYIDDCIAGMSTGMYAYLAHPDLFMRGREKFDDFARNESRRLCEWCKENNVLMEYNLEGARACEVRGEDGYPYDGFWEIAAETGNRVIVGIDAHRCESLEANPYFDKAYEKLKNLGMEIVTEIPMRTYCD